MTMILLEKQSSLAICATIALSFAGMGSVQAQHGHHGGGHSVGNAGHSIGHAGHGIGHAGHSIGHSTGHGISHGIGHSFGHGIGHSIGHGIGHSISHGIGHSIGHGNAHYDGHINHGHYDFGHSVHPHIDVYASPYYAGYGHSSVGHPHLHASYYDYYAPAPYSVAPSVVVSPSVAPNVATYSAAKPAISSDSSDAISSFDSLGSRNNPYRTQAEQAFRNSNYGEAVRLANHALVESPNDGKLMLLYSQGLFAVGDYQGAAGAIHRAASMLNPEEWGYVVQNYAKYYQGNGFVDQMSRLESFLKANPDAAYARFLRGYQFGFLGQNGVAIRDLNRALELESRDQLAAELVTRFGGTPVNVPTDSSQQVNQPDAQQSDEPIRMDSPPPAF